jgi:hypothetical protein
MSEELYQTNVAFDIFGRPLAEPGLARHEALRRGKKRDTDCTCGLCYTDGHCPVCGTPLCWYVTELVEQWDGALMCRSHYLQTGRMPEPRRYRS